MMGKGRDTSVVEMKSCQEREHNQTGTFSFFNDFFRLLENFFSNYAQLKNKFGTSL